MRAAESRRDRNRSHMPARKRNITHYNTKGSVFTRKASKQAGRNPLKHTTSPQVRSSKRQLRHSRFDTTARIFASDNCSSRTRVEWSVCDCVSFRVPCSGSIPGWFCPFRLSRETRNNRSLPGQPAKRNPHCHGADDDQVPVAPCRDYVQRLRAAGADVQLTEFLGAHHAYDNPLGGFAARPIEPRA
jgi:hypothetical protein